MTTLIPTITPKQLHAAQLRGNRPALLDVRTAAEYRAGHIPGAQRLPVGDLRPDEVTSWFKHAATPRHQEPLYITCRNGTRARQAAECLQLAGITRWCGMTRAGCISIQFREGVKLHVDNLNPRHRRSTRGVT